MRGYTEQGKLVNEAIVAEAPSMDMPGLVEFRAELRIAGVGTWLGDWRKVKGEADDDLCDLQAKHQPSKPSVDGISPKQQADFMAALSDAPKPLVSEDEVARFKREVGHGFNMAYEG